MLSALLIRISQPVISQPVFSQPVFSQPVLSQPVLSQPGSHFHQVSFLFCLLQTEAQSPSSSHTHNLSKDMLKSVATHTFLTEPHRSQQKREREKARRMRSGSIRLKCEAVDTAPRHTLAHHKYLCKVSLKNDNSAMSHSSDNKNKYTYSIHISETSIHT